MRNGKLPRMEHFEEAKRCFPPASSGVRWRLGLLVAAVSVICGVGSAAAQSAAPEPEPTFGVGTPADRAALFDFLVRSTMEWDAFASLPDHPYYRAHPKGVDVLAEMHRFRDELIAADTDEKLWFALWKISNARKDTHLRVSTVDGGLTLPDSLEVHRQAPVRFAVDYAGLDDRFFFVADLGKGIERMARGPAPSLGDRVVGINGRTAEEYVEAIRPYRRYSTENHFWWRLADDLNRTRDFVPHSAFYGESFELVLERRDGSRYEVTLPYLNPREIEWAGHGERRYPGFSHVPELSGHETYDLYLPDDLSLPLVLLQWHGFRPDLPEAMDRLMEYAEAEGLLDRHVIVDATRSGGGSRGAYAVQRIQPRPFRTTFGNLKVSEAMERWVEARIASLRRNSGARETVDGGNWLLEWLEDDVRRAIAEGRRYTNDVPFKGAHLPKWADGIIDPAPVHFRGGLTVWLSAHSGSHLDQFASQVVDNGLGHVMGMAAGGFSNTWQAEEVLRFPTTGKPIVSYMWSMGHSLRPNREILQYNPAEVHEYIPQTRENYFDYHPDLLRRTLERLELSRAGGVYTPEGSGS